MSSNHCISIKIFESLIPYIESGDKKAFQLELRKNPSFDVNFKHNGQSLIHLAVKEDQCGIVQLLIENGASVNSPSEDSEDTPLLRAVRENRLETTKTLLKNYADVNLKNNRGETPLFIAFSKNRLAVGKVLLKRTPDGKFEYKTKIDDVDEKGQTLRSIIMSSDKKAWQNLIQPSNNSPARDISHVGVTNWYEATDGASAAMAGNIYQVWMFILICIRARKLYKRFELSPEMKDAGKFDDLVIKYERNDKWYYRFIQLKHKNSATKERNKICAKYLRQKGNDFELAKYIDSVVKIKGNAAFKDGETEDFIICTTAHIDDSEKALFSEDSSHFSQDPLLFFTDGAFEGKLNRLVRSQLPVDENWNPLNGISEADLEDIFQKAYFITSYPNEALLGQYILKEFSVDFQPSNANLFNDSFAQKVIRHILHLKGHPITETIVEDFLKAIRADLSIQVCVALTENLINDLFCYEIHFKDSFTNLAEFIGTLNLGKSFTIKTDCIELALINVVDELKRQCYSADDFFLVDHGSWINAESRKHVSMALETSERVLCVFIGGQTEQIANEVSNINSNAKLIIIEKSSSQPAEDEKLAFENLQDAAKLRIVNREILFQGEKKKISDLVNFSEAGEILDTRAMLAIVRNEEIYIAKEKEKLVDETYIDRVLLSKAENKFPVEYREKKLVGGGISTVGRLITVQGEPGLGKSSLLKNLQPEMQKSGSYWVLLLNLNDFTLNDKKSYHLSKLKSDAPIDFLCEMLTFVYEFSDVSRFMTKKLFHLCLSAKSPLRLIVLLDAFDEIAPRYEEIVFHLIDFLIQCSVSQIWITTRPHETPKISSRLETNNFVLRPFSAEDQMRFLLRNCRVYRSEIRNHSAKLNLLTLFRVIANGSNVGAGWEKYGKKIFDVLDLPEEPETQSSHNKIDNTLIENISQFIRNPLQFKMLFDLCLKDVAFWKLSLNKMFESFSHSKFKIFFENKANWGSGSVNIEARKKLHKDLVDDHCLLAYQTLFENQITMEPETLKRISRAGIVMEQKEQYSFVYKSYAEHYAAKYLMREKLGKDLALMSEVFLEPKYELISTFINDELREDARSETYIKISKDNEAFFKRTQNGSNVLHIASQRGHIEIIKYFKRILSDDTFRALITALARRDETTLDKAALSRKYAELFKLFKENLGGEPFEGLLQSSRHYGYRVLKAAAETGTYQHFKEFFADFHPGKPICKFLLLKNEREQSIAHVAIIEGSFKAFAEILAPLLVESSLKQLLISTDDCGETVLHKAAASGSFRHVMPPLQQSLSKDELKELFRVVAKNGTTILNTAAYSGYFAVTAEFVLESLGPEDFEELILKTNNDGWTCLHAASMAGYCEDVVNFLKKNLPKFALIDLVLKSTNFGSTTLNIAAYHGHFTATAKLFIKTLEEDRFRTLLLTADKFNSTCLHHAAQTGHVDEVIRFLKDKFPDEIEDFICMSGDEGETILHTAASYGNFGPTATLVLQNLADKKRFKKLMSQKSDSNLTCLDIAEKSGNLNEVLSFLKMHFNEEEIEQIKLK